jgi:hypothetical protein
VEAGAGHNEIDPFPTKGLGELAIMSWVACDTAGTRKQNPDWGRGGDHFWTAPMTTKL